MTDKNLYANDLIHRFASHTFTETTVNDLTKVEFKDGGSVVIGEATTLVVIDAYRTIRNDLLGEEKPVFLSTTTQRDLLSVDKGTVIFNLTNVRFEVFDGTDWIGKLQDISCKVTKSADQSISNSTSTIITWDQEDYDTDGMHDNVTNNTRITIKSAGKYSVMAQFEWESNSSGKRIIDIMKNSVALGKANYLASGSSQHTLSFIDEFAVNDILEVRVFQDSGGSLDFLDNITYFEAHKIN